MGWHPLTTNELCPKYANFGFCYTHSHIYILKMVEKLKCLDSKNVVSALDILFIEIYEGNFQDMPFIYGSPCI